MRHFGVLTHGSTGVLTPGSTGGALVTPVIVVATPGSSGVIAFWAWITPFCRTFIFLLLSLLSVLSAVTASTVTGSYEL